MDSFICCNPIHIDDEQIDLELEEIWEMQRRRSRGGGALASARGRMNFFRGNKNRRGFSLTRNGKNSTPQPIKYDTRRTMSTGRTPQALEKQRGRSRSPWGINRDRRVSINKYVEKIETKPKTGNHTRGRSISRERRQVNSRGSGSIGNSHSSRRSNNHEIRGKARSRSWSIGRRKVKNTPPQQQKYGIITVRSRSEERRNSRGRHVSTNSYDDGESKRGFLGGLMGRRSDYRDDESESWSSSEDSYTEVRGGFFGSFR
mmetsp:Transcript_9771/g.18373  ORF Transcript_9771/g.18373 Transcript_9771/m.18373 type:complete len:259 (-) Transcript_9771:133-909(-)